MKLSRKHLGGVAIVAAAVAITVLWFRLHATESLPAAAAPLADLAETSGPSTPATRARRVLAPLLKEVPGLSVSVWAGGGIAWSEGLGYADLKSRTPVRPSTLFRVYSLSKPLTAAAALSLAGDRLLDLDAPIATHVSGLPPDVGRVTARQLLGHLGGIRDYKDGEWLRVSRSGCRSAGEALAPFVNDPLQHPPGDAFLYSSFGYVLLSAVIEGASGLNFEACLRRRVFEPAGLVETLMDPPGGDPAATATFYEPAPFGRVRRARAVENGCKLGAGSLLSTSEDLARFSGALIEGKAPAPSSVELMLRPMTVASGESTGYGCGFGLSRDKAGRPFASHRGGAIGGRGVLLVYPLEKVAVVVLSNIDGPSMAKEAFEVAELFMTPEDGR